MTHKDRNLEIAVRQLFCFLRLFGFAGGSETNNFCTNRKLLDWKLIQSFDFSHLRAESAFRQREKKSKTWFTCGSETNNFCTNWKLSDWKLLLEWKFHRKVLTNIILTDRNLKIIALICRLLFRELWEKKRLLIFGQTLFVSGLKVHLDKELKIGLREKALLNGRSENDRKTKHYEHLTHAYVLWAANVLLAVFAPAFPLSLLRQEIRPQAAQAHSLGR